MIRIKIGFGLAVALAILMVASGINCTSESDDDDNDSSDDDDSDSEGCHQVINPEADETNASTMNISSPDVSDCLPELPDPIHEELLTALLEAYLGQYHSEVGTIRTISCRPEGEWEVPNYDAEGWWCGYHYTIPVLIELEEITGFYKGSIEQEVKGDCTLDNLFDVWSSLRIEMENETINADGSIGEYIIWEFDYVDEAVGFITWKKDEPFAE